MKIFITSAKIEKVGAEFRIHRMDGKRKLFHTTRPNFHSAEREAINIQAKVPYLWKEV